jgi:hypothetical protein
MLKKNQPKQCYYCKNRGEVLNPVFEWQASKMRDTGFYDEVTLIASLKKRYKNATVPCHFCNPTKK